MALRRELTRLVEAVDAEGIEWARGQVTESDVPELVAWYFTLDEWPQRLALMDLIQDHYHPSMDQMMVHVLQAPGDGDDWVDLPKAVAVGKLSEDHDNFMTYYNDRKALGRAIDEALAARGIVRESPAEQPKEVAPALPDDPEDALWIAATSGQTEEVVRLATSASTNMSRGGDPILVRTIINGHERAALALLDADADPNATRDTGGQTALSWAAFHGHETLAAKLLERGAILDSLDQYQSTPLVNAASSGHLGVVQLLLERGANPRQCISDGRSVLNLSVRGGKAKILAALLNAGASLVDKQPTFTPLAFACFEGTTAMVRLLAKRGADVNVRTTYMNYRGTTPLMFAAQANKADMVNALLDAGAIADLTDESGRGAADYAKGSRAAAICDLLSAAR